MTREKTQDSLQSKDIELSAKMTIFWLIISMVIAALGIAVIVIKVVEWTGQRDRVVLEQEFKFQFKHALSEDRQVLRPVVVARLVATRQKLDIAKASIAYEMAKSFRGTSAEATLIVHYLEEAERLKKERDGLSKRFSAMCETAKGAGFAEEALASSCGLRGPS